MSREAMSTRRALRTPTDKSSEEGVSSGQSLTSSLPMVPMVLRRQETAVPAWLRASVSAAPVQHTARSGVHALRSCSRLPHSAGDTPQRPQKALHRPGGSDG